MSLKPKYVDFDKTWMVIKNTITQVLTFKSVSRNAWNDSFNDIYALCVAYPEPLADRLYDETKDFLNKWTKEYQRHLLEKDHHEFLEAYSDIWNIFSTGIRYVDNLYRYLNHQHIKRHNIKSIDCTYNSLCFSDNDNMKEIGNLALEMWKHNVVLPTNEMHTQLMLKEIERFRMSEISCEDSSLKSKYHIQSAANSFIEVEINSTSNKTQFYEDVFEDELLSATGTHYATESVRLIQENNISDYMKKVLIQLELESKRAMILFPVSQKKLLHQCRLHLIKNKLCILNAEAINIINDGRLIDLQNLYLLLKPIREGLNELLKNFQEHIENTGSRQVSRNDEPNAVEEFIEHILRIRDKYFKIIVDTFKSDTAFLGVLDKACCTIVNRNSSALESAPADLLVRYCDAILKKTSKDFSENEIERKLDNVVTIFRYIEDKDIFQKFYAKYLGKRLIHQQSNSMDTEEALINRLKAVCGFEFTNQFHRMFTDISVSDDLSHEFNMYAEVSNVELPINFTMKVLTQGFWPISQNSSSYLALPIELEQSMQLYEKFYFSRFQGRKLTWIHHMSTVEIQLSYLQKNYFVTMNTQQMAILLLFQFSDGQGFEEILNATKLSEDQLTKYLNTFVNSKILLSENDHLTHGSKICLNLSYSNKKTKFKMTGVFSKDLNIEVKHTSKIVDEDRKMYLQATIVRVMKCRKILEHSELIREVLNQCKARFKPSIPMIKKCIESLIDKAYLERVSNSNKYSYVA